ncbi:MAG: hypothetical protein ACYS6W_04210 [Planctomycetota bacterium]|jgi:hypothetical protein
MAEELIGIIGGTGLGDDRNAFRLAEHGSLCRQIRQKANRIFESPRRRA